MKIRCSNMVIHIHTPFEEYYRKIWHKYLVSDDVVADFEVKTNPEDVEGFRLKEPGLNDYDYESVAILEQIVLRLVDYDAYFMHAAVIAVDGKAYAFSAKSGTGKSTHINLWRTYFGDRATIINGDKPFMQIKGDDLYAVGTPWCGKEGWGTNTSLPLQAICFLERGNDNRIRRASNEEIVNHLFKQVVLPPQLEHMSKFLSLIEWTMETIPFYILTCTISEEAVELAYDTMSEGERNEN